MNQTNHNHSFIELINKSSPSIKIYHSPTSPTTPNTPKTNNSNLTNHTYSWNLPWVGLDLFILDQVYDPTILAALPKK